MQYSSWRNTLSESLIPAKKNCSALIMFSNKKPVPSDVKKNIYIYDATGWQDAAFARTVLLLGPLDDEDRAFAVLRAVVADAAQERPARSHTAIRTSDGRVNVKIGGDGKQKIFLLRSLSSRWPWHRFRVIEMDACTPSNEM